MGIYSGKLYYDVTDFDNSKIYIKSYDFKTGKESIVREVDFEEGGPSTLEVKDGILVAYNTSKSPDALFIKDLKRGKESQVKIPEDIEYVYAASYDKENDTYMIYYDKEDSKAEYIGIFKPDDSKIKAIFTMPEGMYAYREQVTIDNGHVFWVTEENTTGPVVDHYTLVDYDCADDSPYEVPASFGYALTEDTIYMISFVDESVKKINITEEPI